MKCVILARVSSNEQKDGKSLDAQVESAERYAKEEGFEIIKIYRIVESSTTGKRKEFREMIDFIKKQKESIAIVCDTVDRFQRSFKEKIEFEPLIESGKVELHFVSSGFNMTKDAELSDEMMWTSNVYNSDIFIKMLKHHTRKGLKRKVADGELAGLAPVGYLNAENPLNAKKRTVIIDEDKAYLVKKLFQEYATGIVSLRNLTEKAKEYGLKNRNGNYFTKSTIQRTISNPFYIGYISYKGELYKHNYPLFIDKALFDKCQSTRDKLRLNNTKSGSKSFIFGKGILKCDCGCAISSAEKKGKYIYLNCSHYKGNCNQPEVNENIIILNQAEQALDNIAIPDEYFPSILENLQEYERLEASNGIYISDTACKDIEKVDSTLKKLLDLRLAEELTQEEYAAKKNELISKKAELEATIKADTSSPQEFRLSMELILKMTQKAIKLFKSSKVETKNKILNIVLWNLKLKNKVLDFSYRSPFDAVKNLQYGANGVADGT